jgi:hypothetical protein
MDKILELLGANKLNEETQNDLKEKLQTIVEVEAKKLSESTLAEEKDKLVEDMEKKFDDYKEEITSKFSNFVDGVLEQELKIPEKVLEYAKKGELYHDLIEQFKVRLGVDQGLLDEEVKGLLKEAKTEIVKLRDDMNKTIAENLELKSDAQELAAEVYLYQKCDGLTESQRKQVFSILQGVTDRDEIDRKFQVIADSERFDPVDVGDEDDPDKAGEKVRGKNKKTSDPKNNEKQVEEEYDNDDEKGKGKAEMDDDEDDKKKKKKDDDEDDDDKMDENNPFTQFKKGYLKVLQENRVTN